VEAAANHPDGISPFKKQKKQVEKSLAFLFY
jgi:hypothetical protein